MNIIQSVVQGTVPFTGALVPYTVTYTNGVVCFVPQAANNSDYQAVQAWVAAGGTVQQL